MTHVHYDLDQAEAQARRLHAATPLPDDADQALLAIQDRYFELQIHALRLLCAEANRATSLHLVATAVGAACASIMNTFMGSADSQHALIAMEYFVETFGHEPNPARTDLKEEIHGATGGRA